MSLIYEALKKAQINQDAGPVSMNYRIDIRSEEQRTRRWKAYLPAFVIFVFIVAVIWGWQTAGRLNTSSAEVLRYKKNITVSAKKADVINRDDNLIESRLEDARIKNMQGMELYREGRFSIARDKFLSSVKIFPEYAEAYNNLGLTYKQMGDIRDAEDSYKKAIQYKHEYHEAMNNYGVLLDSIGDSVRAREYFRESMKAAPDYPDPYLNMAISLEKEKRFEDAVIFYEGFLSRAKQGNKSLIRNVQERMLYLNAGRLDAQRQ